MNKTFILTFLISCSLSSFTFAEMNPLKVTLNVKNEFEKSCIVQLSDDILVLEQSPLDKDHSDELTVTLKHISYGADSTDLSPELGYFVSNDRVNTLNVNRTNKPDVSLAKIISSNDLNLMLEALLKNTEYVKGGTYSGYISISKIVEALRAKCDLGLKN